jgi:transmembrane sensor
MSNSDSEQLTQEAIGWRIRLQDAPAAHWEAFTLWLERSPYHAAAYDAVAIADHGLGGLQALPIASNDDIAMAPAPARKSHLRLALPFAAIAALLLAMILAYPLYGPGAGVTTFATAPGQSRSVTLADGTRIDMNGATRLALDSRHPRRVSLEGGEATFHVVHDADTPFVVAAGETTLRDVGTVFNVVREGERIDVAVAEGAVLYNPDAEAIQLNAGQRLRFAGAGHGTRIGRVDPQAVGAWHQGRLVYDNAPLATVAADIARTLGTTLVADPAVATRPFTGVITIDRDQPAFFRKLDGLLDVAVVREGTGWRLVAGGRAPS